MSARPEDAVVLHITTPEAWARARADGFVTADSLATEGFLHCSTPAQVVATADRIFAGAGDLLVLVVDPARLTAPLRHETADVVGEAFPHVYGTIDVGAVLRTAVLREGPGGYAAPDDPAFRASRRS
ncbi:DUF952 domain-containing protein [Baekduia soli]|uniref:DUF952 domain-containing protein n=1 Tax=Baekduia soli TaxID=496014 RepID=A0A5B8UBR7_9ACTN|nr:DUF952 domain-containing protein [Baekduia soli]QEC50659.1 DUF952 domain-containing protein [Baekduia soli]